MPIFYKVITRSKLKNYKHKHITHCLLCKHSKYIHYFWIFPCNKREELLEGRISHIYVSAVKKNHRFYMQRSPLPLHCAWLIHLPRIEAPSRRSGPERRYLSFAHSCRNSKQICGMVESKMQGTAGLIKGTSSGQTPDGNNR